MFISLKKHNKILAETKKELEDAKKELEDTKKNNCDQFTKIHELEKNFDKELEKQVKQKIDWYNEFAEKLLKESKKYDNLIETQLGDFFPDEEYKIARLLIQKYLDKNEFIKKLNNDISKMWHEIWSREDLFNKYIDSLQHNGETKFFYQTNYSTDIEKHKTFYIAFLEQIDKLKSELELAKQELATQVANNITLTNELKIRDENKMTPPPPPAIPPIQDIKGF